MVVSKKWIMEKCWGIKIIYKRKIIFKNTQIVLNWTTILNILFKYTVIALGSNLILDFFGWVLVQGWTFILIFTIFSHTFSVGLFSINKQKDKRTLL